MKKALNNLNLLAHLILIFLGVGLIAGIILKDSYFPSGYLLGTLFGATVLLYAMLRKKVINPFNKLNTYLISQRFEGSDNVDVIIEKHIKLRENISAATDFIRKIEKGNLNEAYSGEATDELGASLLDMREHLIEISRQEKERIWISEGLAKFSDLLRVNDKDINSFCYNVLYYLIKYINISQGALFLVQQHEDADEHLEMVACYAYNQKKFLRKSVAKGQGLVGQVWLEKEKVLLSEVPQNYITITSGLGDANPNYILIVPLKVNEEVVGVLELASFSTIPPYHIEFIEKLTENFASTISMVKVNEQTKKLLEESQEMTEQMRSQEEEMRQNLEELSATQEELRRKEIELDRRLKEALEKIEQGHINQQMNEIALQIEHSIDSSKRDLKFLSNVPPVQGIIRALENDNFDLKSNSSYEDWIERIDTIFQNFLFNKELFHAISFTDEKGKLLYRLSFDGAELVRNLTSDLNYQHEGVFKNTSRLEQGEVYVGNIKALPEKVMVMEFGIAIFNENNSYKATLLVDLLVESIIEDITSKEDGGHRYGLFTSEGICIYGDGLSLENGILKKEVVTNQAQKLSLTIMHQ